VRVVGIERTLSSARFNEAAAVKRRKAPAIARASVSTKTLQ
jgi:hypothetical protein